MKKILFVCAGNQCRSPIAEALFKNMIKNDSLDEQVYIDSAGIYASSGAQPSSKACEIMRQKNIDISSKLSKALDEEKITDSDLVITMEYEQKDYIQSAFPKFKSKVFSLRELAGDEGDIKDPMGGAFEVYERCAGDIENALSKAKSRIFKILASS